MMKPSFKALDSADTAPWFDTGTVWFVASLSCVNMTLKSGNILVRSCSLVQYQAYSHLALRPTTLRFGDYKPDIALVP